MRLWLHMLGIQITNSTHALYIMMDEAGANLQGLLDVFGEEFLERISTCQWHFKECAHRQLINVKKHQWKLGRKNS